MNDPNAENLDRLSDARNTEIALIGQLQGCLEDMARVVGERLENLSPSDIEDLPVRLLPQMLKAFTEGLTVLQASHDRLSGYALLMKELEDILESKSAKTSNH